MKIQRSSKMHFGKWLTKSKQSRIDLVLTEYAMVVNYFISKYEADIPEFSRFKLCYAVYIQECKKVTGTWLSARMIKNAFSEGYGMVKGAKEAVVKTEKTYKSPVHYGKKAILSSTIATQSGDVKTVDYDFNITLGSIGNKLKISIPLKKHKHWLNLNDKGKRSSSIVLTRKYVQFSFESETGKKKESGLMIGIDIGINKLLAVSDGSSTDGDYAVLLGKLRRKKPYSKAYYRTKAEIKSYIDFHVKRIFEKDIQLVVVENLKGLKNKMKERRRLSKNMRRVVNVWAYRYVLTRIEQLCEDSRASFRTVSAYNTSITCPKCGHIDKKNRKTQELFLCLNCGYASNADLNAAKNILIRFITGPYCARFKPDDYMTYLSIG